MPRKPKRSKLPRQRNPMAYNLFTSGLYGKKVEKAKKGKGSYDRKVKDSEPQ